MRTILAVLCLLLPAMGWAQVSSTRETTYDYACCDDQGCKALSSHQRLDSAYTACVNKSIADGKPRWVQGGRWRVTASLPQPVPTTLEWVAPARRSDGSTITGVLTYRVESSSSQAGPWTRLATVSALTYTTQGPGCWRIVAIEGTAESVPSNPVCN